MNGSTQRVRIVCVSDTHNAAPGEGYTLPKGDVLIHAGDLTNQGSYAELKKAITWIQKADYAAKIIVAGNHDLSLDPNYSLKYTTGWSVKPDDVNACRELVSQAQGITYLEHSAATINLPEKNAWLRVFGSPFSPDRSQQNWAFQYRDEDAVNIWKSVPENVDILVTHTPPAENCDASHHWKLGGCRPLLQTLSQIRPLLHICGHHHEGRGADIIRWSEDGAIESVTPWDDPGLGNKKQSLLNLSGVRGGTLLQTGRATAIVNASIMARSFGRGSKEFNKPVVVDIALPG